tara:strand:- start:1215 stop:1508 length:294 start_codon:yes stop_codon:yes gene_type:complete
MFLGQRMGGEEGKAAQQILCSRPCDSAERIEHWFGLLPTLMSNCSFGSDKSLLHPVFLMRLSPLLPFPLVSYVFGISQVGFGNYILGSTAGLIPGMS